MSFNRENIVWQSADGTWSRGFYRVTWTDPDGDPEWDVEYGDDFEWVSTGHPTEDAAIESWDGANPGGHNVLTYSPDGAARATALDELAAKCKAEFPPPPRDRWDRWGR